jgi:hypothetical protein
MMLTPESGQQYALPDLPMMSDGTNTPKAATNSHKNFPHSSRRAKTTSPLPQATREAQMTQNHPQHCGWLYALPNSPTMSSGTDATTAATDSHKNGLCAPMRGKMTKQSP